MDKLTFKVEKVDLLNTGKSVWVILDDRGGILGTMPDNLNQEELLSIAINVGYTHAFSVNQVRIVELCNGKPVELLDICEDCLGKMRRAE